MRWLVQLGINRMSDVWKQYGGLVFSNLITNDFDILATTGTYNYKKKIIIPSWFLMLLHRSLFRPFGRHWNNARNVLQYGLTNR